MGEMIACNQRFYSLARILRRAWSGCWHRRQPLISLVGNLSYRNNIRVDCKTYADFKHDLCSLFGPNQMEQRQSRQQLNWESEKEEEREDEGKSIRSRTSRTALRQVAGERPGGTAQRFPQAAARSPFRGDAHEHSGFARRTERHAKVGGGVHYHFLHPFLYRVERGKEK